MGYDTLFSFCESSKANHIYLARLKSYLSNRWPMYAKQTKKQVAVCKSKELSALQSGEQRGSHRNCTHG